MRAGSRSSRPAGDTGALPRTPTGRGRPRPHATRRRAARSDTRRSRARDTSQPAGARRRRGGVSGESPSHYWRDTSETETLRPLLLVVSSTGTALPERGILLAEAQDRRPLGVQGAETHLGSKGRQL